MFYPHTPGKKEYSGIFRVTDCEFLIRFSKLKMADSRWGCWNEKPRYIVEKVDSGIFGVADYESVIRFSKLKMADSRWWPLE